MPKIIIRIPDALSAQIDARSGFPRDNFSEALRECLERYFYLLELSRREIRDSFTGGELSLLADICNGTMFETHSLQGVLFNAQDAEDMYYVKWGVDRDALLQKLGSLTPCQHAAIVDAIEIFWDKVSKFPSLEQPQPRDLLK